MWSRPVRVGGWAAIAVIAMVGLGACGQAAEDKLAGGGESAEQDPPDSSANHLEITVTDGAGKVTTWTLTCDEPPGGTHPKPAEACAALAAHEKSLQPVSADAICTMQYGGADRAVVVGTYRGEKVKSSFNLNGGCEIARWNSLVPLLPPTEDASGRLRRGTP